ncbi:beta-ketoacyl synthase N-terminal-like domain-containing protein [Streptomyces sp. DG1A-41]|uniref:type I polyketide synthase n=1 Tax=Streptomyces sp. DG1A-41 TaxID=3125779 RepID=UPI0030CD168F
MSHGRARDTDPGPRTARTPQGRPEAGAARPRRADHGPHQDHAPVAVVGMACRFPGADGLAAFWRLLLAGEDAIAPGTGARAGRRPGGYLPDVDRFDAEFFGVPALEAATLDPQQRLLLELTWHALEDARTPPRDLSPGPVGVFVGAGSDEYAFLSRTAAGPPSTYTMTGTGRTFLANRLSHFYGFTGPSLVVDTGQSSSLAALHQAVLALRRGECAAAVVGGVQLNLTAEGDDVVEALGALSPRGRCHTFDARADGIVRGEGAGVVVLKPLDRARADGDRVYCTLLGGAMNSDGDRTALTAPSEAAQREVLAVACREAGTTPADVHYVELHGTGTALGDPVEAAALGGVLGDGRPGDRPLLVGSVKTNIGHLEAAAGIAGFIKTALALFHRELPASLNFRTANPAIDLEALRVRVCERRRDWPAGDAPRIAGVSSFGLGGTNCHVVLGEAPEPAVPAAPAGSVSAVPVVLSGPTTAVVRARARDLADAVGDTGRQVALADLAWTAATARTAFGHRAGVIASDRDELAQRLRALADGSPDDGERGIVQGPRGEGRTAFLFAGQGAQRLGMGQALYKEFPVFAEAFDEARAHLEPVLGADLADAMWQRQDVDRSEHAQPALFAVEVALHRLLESLGLVPDLLVGHSLGEIAVAHLTGVLSLPDAAALVAHRARLIGELPPGGAMVAVQAEEDEARGVVERAPGLVGIAAVNGSRSIVLSGEEGATLKAAAHFEGLGRRTRRLRVSVAGHSPLMAPVQERLRSVAESLTWNAPTGPPVVSTVTGEVIEPDRFADAEYWVHHVCAPVRFGPALGTAHLLGARFFVEIGPGRALTTLAAETAGHGAERFSAPMETRDETACVAQTAAAAHVFGLPVRWEALLGGRGRHVDLPLYPFQRRRHWLDTALGTTPPPAEAPAPRWHGDPFDLVVSCTLQTLGLDPDADLDVDRSFSELGLDSRMAVALRTTLARITGRSLPATLLFDRPTPASLIEAFRTDAPL